MTETISSSTNNASLNALSDLRSFFRNGGSKLSNADNSVEENDNRSNLTRKTLNELITKYNRYNSESTKENSGMQNINTQTNPLPINTPAESAQSPLKINRPETKSDTNPLQIDTSSRSAQSNRPETKAETSPLQINAPSKQAQSPLDIKRPETKTNAETNSFSLPKNKNSILSQLKMNAMSSKLTAREIAQKYNIPYIEAQGIYVELNQNSNGIVKELNIPDNSTVSYLV